MRLLIACTLCSLFSFANASAVAAASGDDESAAIAAVERALHDGKNGPVLVLSALGELRGRDSVAVAEVLVKVFVDLEQTAQATEKQAHAELTKGELSDGQIVSRRQQIDPIRKAQSAVLDRVATLRNTEALVWLIDHVIGDDKVGISLKVEAARSAAPAGEPIVAALVRALPRVKKSDDWMALLLAAQLLEKKALPLAPSFVPLIDHAEATIRENAALALAKIAVPEAIEPLVHRMEKESGRTLVRIAAALEILTRQKLGASAGAWKSWFAAEGLRYTSGQAELGGGEPAVVMAVSGYFHGIPQDSRSIIYVIDVSGSMMVSMTNPKFEDAAQTKPIPAPAGEESRMETSKKELIHALGELPPTTKFAIVYFSTGADRWQPKMVDASPAMVKKAQKWVAELGPGGATNIHDAMESAFALAGRGAADKYYDSTVDTIFLLTDGQPFLPGGPDSTERIIQLVRRENPIKRVTVHTIGLGKGIDADFLRKLASENGGVFVQR